MTDDRPTADASDLGASPLSPQRVATVGWTGLPELDAVLVELVDQARTAFGSTLVGSYLHGSFALGGADEESDCDFLVVVSRPPNYAQLASLRAFHAELPHRAGYWNKHLEGSYALATDLSDPAGIGRPWPFVDHGSDRVVLDDHSNTEVTRWVLHRAGVVLHGPAPTTLLDAVPAEAMRQAARRDLRPALAAWTRDAPHDVWAQRYCVVMMARMLRTLVIGDVVSKPQAVAWAAQTMDPQWHTLLEAALAQRGQRPWDAPVPEDVAERTVEFANAVADLVDRDRPAQ